MRHEGTKRDGEGGETTSSAEWKGGRDGSRPETDGRRPRGALRGCRAVRTFSGNRKELAQIRGECRVHRSRGRPGGAGLARGRPAGTLRLLRPRHRPRVRPARQGAVRPGRRRRRRAATPRRRGGGEERRRRSARHRERRRGVPAQHGEGWTVFRRIGRRVEGWWLG